MTRWNNEYGMHSIHSLAILVAEVCTTLACCLSMFLIFMHIVHYTCPNQQRPIIRILAMIPIYGTSSLLSLYFRHYGLYFDTMRDLYEAYVIYNFMGLLMQYLGGVVQCNALLSKKAPMRHPFPFTSLSPVILADSMFLLRARQGTLQYVIVKPFLAILKIILSTRGLYQDGEFLDVTGAFFWISLLENMSVAIAMYSLLLFYMAMHEDLRPYKPVSKFVCVKAVIFFSFWQGMVVDFLVEFQVIQAVGGWTTRLISVGLQNLFICVEMLVAALAHQHSFPYSIYIRNDWNERAPLLSRTRDVVGVHDVFDDVRQTFGRSPAKRTSTAFTQTSHTPPHAPIDNTIP